MTRKIHISALAESDLIGIWTYSFEQWGEAQADLYLDELDRGIASLVESPALGASRDHAREGYRVLFVQQHAVYYKVTDSNIHVIRILHKRMDAERHL